MKVNGEVELWKELVIKNSNVGVLIYGNGNKYNRSEERRVGKE